MEGAKSGLTGLLAGLAAGALLPTAAPARLETPAQPAAPAAAAKAAFRRAEPGPWSHRVRELRGNLADADGRAWVDIAVPERLSPGYNLLLYNRRTPILVDVDGRIAHAWPEVRARGRARLLRNGDLLVFAGDAAIRRYDWEGSLLWSYPSLGEKGSPADALIRLGHHDLIQLANGNVLSIFKDKALKSNADVLLELDERARIVWRWDMLPHLDGTFRGRINQPSNPSHFNSVEELPPNPWYEQGDSRFRPGNILVSARTLDTIFIIDKLSGKIVWSYSKHLVRQHEARMVPAGMPHAGEILVFNNNTKKRMPGPDRSQVLRIDPRSGTVTWRYESEDFLSPHAGVQQLLPNGNVLITSSGGGRMFEVTPEGETVWQLTPEWDPMRPVRYPYDHSPQLAALPRAKPKRIQSRHPDGFLDQSLYWFIHPDSRGRTVTVGGKNVVGLPGPRACSRLLLPTGAELSVAFGLHDEPAGVPRAGKASFVVELQSEAQGSAKPPAPVTLVDEQLSAASPAIWEVSVDLASYARQWVQLCLRASGPENRDDELPLFWSRPRVGLRGARARALQPEPTSARERRVDAELLKAIGYID